MEQLLAPHHEHVLTVAFSPDGATIATGCYDGSIWLWSARTLQKQRVLRDPSGHEYISSLAFSPNGRYLAFASGYGIARMWDKQSDKTEEITLETSQGRPVHRVESVAFSPDCNIIALGWSEFDYSKLFLWSITQRKVIGVIKVPDDVHSCAFSPDGATIVSGLEDHTVRMWDIQTLSQKLCLTGHENPVRSVAFAPRGNVIASAGIDDEIRLWNTETGRLSSSLEGHQRSINSVAFSPDGATVASGSFDNTAKLWNAKTGALRATLTHPGAIAAVAFSPDGKTLATGSYDKTLRLWDISKVVAQ